MHERAPGRWALFPGIKRVAARSSPQPWGGRLGARRGGWWGLGSWVGAGGWRGGAKWGLGGVGCLAGRLFGSAWAIGSSPECRRVLRGWAGGGRLGVCARVSQPEFRAVLKFGADRAPCVSGQDGSCSIVWCVCVCVLLCVCACLCTRVCV